MSDSLPLQDIGIRLERNGHQLEKEGSAGVRVLHMPESSIVVALQPDATLYAAYRRRFFLCRPGAEAILTRAACPVSVCRQWSELLVRIEPAQSRDLLTGPGAWALTRLIQHDLILIWGVGSGYREQSYCDTQYELIESDLGKRIDFGSWRKHLIEGTGQEAYCLNPGDDQFTDILAAYFLLSSYECFEFYLTNIDCTEVYEIHHHDKVTASVPDPVSEQELIRSLTTNPDLYADASGYQCSWDDEDEEGSEA